MAADLILEGGSGRGHAARRHLHQRADRRDPRRSEAVDVGELYDVAQYRPKVRHVAGKPMFLY